MKQQLKNSTWIIVAGAIVLILILMVVSPNALRVILSVPLVLFLPGFALTMILFPRNSLGIPQRLLLSVGLSVALTALLGLLLNVMPWGLQAKTLWIALLLCIAIEAVLIFFVRRNWWTNAITLPAGFNFNTRQWVLMALAAVITIMAVRVASAPAPQQGLEGYTMLSIKDASTPDAVRVSVQSDEFKPTSYQIKYEFGGSVRVGSTFQLKPGEIWERVVPIPADVSTGKSFTVLLYRLDNPAEVYRKVIWWPNSH